MSDLDHHMIGRFFDTLVGTIDGERILMSSFGQRSRRRGVIEDHVISGSAAKRVLNTVQNIYQNEEETELRLSIQLKTCLAATAHGDHSPDFIPETFVETVIGLWEAQKTLHPKVFHSVIHREVSRQATTDTSVITLEDPVSLTEGDVVLSGESKLYSTTQRVFVKRAIGSGSIREDHMLLRKYGFDPRIVIEENADMTEDMAPLVWTNIYASISMEFQIHPCWMATATIKLPLNMHSGRAMFEDLKEFFQMEEFRSIETPEDFVNAMDTHRTTLHSFNSPYYSIHLRYIPESGNVSNVLDRVDEAIVHIVMNGWKRSSAMVHFGKITQQLKLHKLWYYLEPLVSIQDTNVSKALQGYIKSESLSFSQLVKPVHSASVDDLKRIHDQMAHESYVISRKIDGVRMVIVCTIKLGIRDDGSSSEPTPVVSIEDAVTHIEEQVVEAPDVSRVPIGTVIFEVFGASTNSEHKTVIPSSEALTLRVAEILEPDSTSSVTVLDCEFYNGKYYVIDILQFCDKILVNSPFTVRFDRTTRSSFGYIRRKALVCGFDLVPVEYQALTDVDFNKLFRYINNTNPTHYSHVEGAEDGAEAEAGAEAGAEAEAGAGAGAEAEAGSEDFFLSYNYEDSGDMDSEHSGNHEVAFDGIVIRAVNHPYRRGDCLKFKPHHKNTLDLLLKEIEPDTLISAGLNPSVIAKAYIAYTTFTYGDARNSLHPETRINPWWFEHFEHLPRFSKSQRRIPVPFITSISPRSHLVLLDYIPEVDLDNKIVECRWDIPETALHPLEGGWVPVGVREDKTFEYVIGIPIFGTFYTMALRALVSILTPLTEEKLSEITTTEPVLSRIVTRPRIVKSYATTTLIKNVISAVIFEKYITPVVNNKTILEFSDSSGWNKERILFSGFRNLYTVGSNPTSLIQYELNMTSWLASIRQNKKSVIANLLSGKRPISDRIRMNFTSRMYDPSIHNMITLWESFVRSHHFPRSGVDVILFDMTIHDHCQTREALESLHDLCNSILSRSGRIVIFMHDSAEMARYVSNGHRELPELPYKLSMNLSSHPVLTFTHGSLIRLEAEPKIQIEFMEQDISKIGTPAGDPNYIITQPGLDTPPVNGRMVDSEFISSVFTDYKTKVNESVLNDSDFSTGFMATRSIRSGTARDCIPPPDYAYAQLYKVIVLDRNKPRRHRGL